MERKKGFIITASITNRLGVLHLLFEANLFHNYKALIKIELIIRCKTGMTPVSFKPTTNRLLLAKERAERA